MTAEAAESSAVGRSRGVKEGVDLVGANAPGRSAAKGAGMAWDMDATI